MNSVLQPSIARRIMVAVLFASATVWLAVYIVGRTNVFASDTGNFDREMLVTATALKRLVENYADRAELRLALEGLSTHLSSEGQFLGTPVGFLAFRVLDVNRAVIFEYGEGPVTWPDADQRTGFYEHSASGIGYRFHSDMTMDGFKRIEISQSYASRQQVFDEVMLSYEGIQPLLLGFPLLLLPVLFAVYSGLSPLRRLCSELAGRMPTDLQPIRAPPVYRELTPLVDELNRALARVSLMMERERSFLADAAHELRTPLAVISAQCENLQFAQSDVLRDESFRRLRQGLQRAGRLVNQLLALARLDSGVEDTHVDIDIADMARDHLAAYAAAARDRGIELSYEGPDSFRIKGPVAAVESILDNLICNAVRYGRIDGRVEVRVSLLESGGVAVCVIDDGPGIAPSERELLFERFHRGSHHGASGSGSGLGLAIVKSAARQLGAEVQVLPGFDGRGVMFLVILVDAGRNLSGSIARHASADQSMRTGSPAG